MHDLEEFMQYEAKKLLKHAILNERYQYNHGLNFQYLHLFISTAILFKLLEMNVYNVLFLTKITYYLLQFAVLFQVCYSG